MNSRGEVVGVNTWSVHGQDGRAQNLNFAISIVDILKALEVKTPLKFSSVNRCGNLKPKDRSFFLPIVLAALLLISTLLIGKSKQNSLFKRINDTEIKFKRWLLNKLIPYLEGTKKKDEDDQ